MPGENKHIYTSEDIRRYHSGAMSQAEMHAMEKAALEDPFLADAMEGFVYSKDMTGEIQSLRVAMEAKTQKKVVPLPVRRNNFGWVRIAALLVVMAGAGWLIFFMNSGEEKTLARQIPVTEKITDTKQSDDVAAGTNIPADTAAEETYVPVIKEQEITAAAPSTIKKAIAKAGNYSSVITIEEPDYRSDALDSTATVSLTPVTTETLSPQKAADSYTFNNKPKVSTLNGYVTDERNNAIPFASVIARNHSGTLTDNNGRFQLTVPDTTTVVDVNAPGYLSRNVNVREAKEDDKIVLQQSNDKLEEVVLARSNAGADKRKQPAKQTIVEIGELEPEGGWSEYNEYLAEKLTAPKNYKKNKQQTGVVELSFDVDDNGNPVNITVEKSLCASCDKEAIRLLKEGPKWKKQEGKGKITIRF